MRNGEKVESRKVEDMGRGNESVGEEREKDNKAMRLLGSRSKICHRSLSMETVNLCQVTQHTAER